MYYMVLVFAGNDTAPSNVTLKFYTAFAILIGAFLILSFMG